MIHPQRHESDVVSLQCEAARNAGVRFSCFGTPLPWTAGSTAAAATDAVEAEDAERLGNMALSVATDGGR